LFNSIPHYFEDDTCLPLKNRIKPGLLTEFIGRNTIKPAVAFDTVFLYRVAYTIKASHSGHP